MSNEQRRLQRMTCSAGLALLLAGCAQSAMDAGGVPTTRPPATTPASDYRLVWSDEFNKDGPLNPADWSFEQGFVRNQELQWYQPENAVCKDGFLIIEARRETKPNPRYAAGSTQWQTSREKIEYTSACAITRGKHAWMYGRFEIRAKIDIRAGSWPAFWMLGVQGGWPANGEIDIMEYYRNMLLANVAWGGARGAVWDTVRKPMSDFPKDWSEKFHVWRMDWDEKFIRLYCDDVMLNETDLSQTINQAPSGGRQGRTAATGPATTLAGGAAPRRGRGNPAPANPFHQPAYVLLNQAIGGQQGGDPANTTFPVRFEVDYIRVYQTPAQIGAATRPATAPGIQSPTRSQ